MGKERRYITGLDGIRTLAVLGVIIYHLFPAQLPGGYLGVTLFFVVSGYLITDLLNQEKDETEQIDIKSFYLRRFKRLYPALLIVLASASTYIVLFQQDLLKNLRAIIVSSVLYVNNWWQIANEVSYFDQFGTPSPFTHIWSLAVEAQFYFIWPFVCVLLYRFVKNRKAISLLITALAIVSAAWMAWLYVPGVDPTRIYYGTDTRVFSILIGCALAFVWPSAQLEESISSIRRWFLNGLGLLAIGYLVYAFMTMHYYDTFLYQGGMVIVSLMAAVLIATVVHPGAGMNRVMTNPIFSWIGTRSYGIYLYQSPVIIFYNAKVTDLQDNILMHTIVKVLIIIILSELSYRLFERPLRRMTWQGVKKYARDFFRVKHLKLKRVSLLIGVGLFTMMGYALMVEPASKQETPSELEQHLQKAQQRADKTKETNIQEDESTSSSRASQKAESTQAEYDENGNWVHKVDDAKLSPAQREYAKTFKMTSIGDSMALDSFPALEKKFPKLVMDAKMGRQLFEVGPVIESMLATKGIEDEVLMILGTNGFFTEKQFGDVMKLLGNRHVYWVNVHTPLDDFEKTVNDTLDQMEKKYDNLTIIDWYSVGRKHPDWFYEDKTHPIDSGQDEYADVIRDAILKDKKVK